MSGILKTIENDTGIIESPVPNEVQVQKLESELETVKKEMQQFAYIVSHDLQAPLRMVTGFLELLEKKHADKLDAEARQYIDYAVKGSVKMKELIFDLLEYSRLSTTAQEKDAVNLTGMIQDIGARLTGTVDMSLSIEAIPFVIGEAKKFEILFTHVLENAVKFRSERPLEIKVGGCAEDGFVKISITDNGIGIDPAFFEKVFIIFRRLNTDEVKYPGTGMGLAMCKKIAELHGGNIGVESLPGSGSTFWVSLPVYK